MPYFYMTEGKINKTGALSLSLYIYISIYIYIYIYVYIYTYIGLFISPSGISELDCTTTKTDTAERSISIDNLSKFFFLY